MFLCSYIALGAAASIRANKIGRLPGTSVAELLVTSAGPKCPLSHLG